MKNTGQGGGVALLTCIMTYFLNFGMAEDTILKFACGLTVKDNKPKNKKTGQKGPWIRSRDLLLKFWDPLISLEWLKIQTSNFACVVT